MGVVYLARDPLIGRQVALKTIRLADSVDEDEAREFRERFLREAQAAGSLNHPSIVTVHDIGQDLDTGFSYIAMEYAEGRNLKELLSTSEPMTYAEVSEIVAQIAEALDYAHAKGVVHRDVKPANIILSDGRAKITDFGIAKIASTVSNLTSTGQFLGTPNYMAPEQVKGTRVDGRTDIFSLGIVLYEALSRRKPFGGDSLTTISYKIVHEPFQSLREIDINIPPGFEQIVAKCLTKEPSVRYQRARDLADDLRRVARGEQPITALGEDASDTLMRPRPDVDQTLVTPFPDMGGTLTADQTPRPAPPKRPGFFKRIGQSRFARVRVHPALFFGIILLLLIGAGAVAFSMWQGQVTVPRVDTRREAAIAKQRQLRLEAEQLLAVGNTEGAYYKYRELLTLAPRSPYVRARLAKLEEVRVAALSERQRLDQARAKLEEGKKLINERKYAEAVPLLEEAFLLDPTLEEATTYLEFATQFIELSKAQQERARVAAAATRSPGAPTPTPAAAGGPATLRVSMNSPVNNGYLLVNVNGSMAAYEALFTERRGLIRRTQPRNLSVEKELPAGTWNIEVVVQVPNQKISERRTLAPVTIRPGSAHTLTVTLDARTRRVEAQFQ
jgi:predicted Ser/Thr protein kinase